MTILVIEDERVIRDMLRTFLELEQYAVITAPDGAEGLALAKRVLPDLIICDVMMPKLDGYQLKKELGKEDTTATIPFIFLTSMHERENIRKGMELGADDYLMKPVNMEELRTAIITQMEKREKLMSMKAAAPQKLPVKEHNPNEFVMLKDKGNPKFVKIGTIICVTAEDKYTKVFLTNGEKIISSLSLKEWEDMVPQTSFIRIHRATLINIEGIEKVEKWFQRSYRVKLKGITEPFEISRRYYSKIREIYGGE